MSIVYLLDAAAQVTIADRITWGQKEQIQAAMLGGVKMTAGQNIDFDASAVSRAKYKALEVCVQGIVVGGEAVKFTKEWMDALSVGDGEALYAAVDAVVNPEKK